jgi:hypothetical protein
MNIREEFNLLLEENNSDNINEFCIRHCRNATLQDIIYMIDNGVDPRYKDDIILIITAASHKKETLIYLIDQYGADINAQNGQALVKSIARKNMDVMIFLLDSGIYISDDAIYWAIYNSKDSSYMETLMRYGVPVERFGNIFWKKYLVNYDFIINKIHVMAENGLDINQSVINYYKTKN